MLFGKAAFLRPFRNFCLFGYIIPRFLLICNGIVFIMFPIIFTAVKLDHCRCCNFINCHVQIENFFLSLPKLSPSNSLSKLLFTVVHDLGQMERADSHKTSPGTQQFFSLWVSEPVADALCQNVPCRIRKTRYFHSK